MVDFDIARKDALQKYLLRHIAGEVRFDQPTRHLYSTDASHYRIEPLGVVIPKTEDDLLSAIQIATDLKLSLVPRGGGTSLTGQSIGAGLILDNSKYLRNILGEVDTVNQTVTVQPGLVLDHLNAAVAKSDLAFGPDVATANRATLGGMIGNNSAGARSVVYGQTVSHVKSLKVILSDGTRATLEAQSPRQLERKKELRTLEGHIYRQVSQILSSEQDEIEKRVPKILRKVSGYNVAGTPADGSNLVPLILASEGTLAMVEQAELRLVTKPKFRGLLVPQFDSLRAALDALAVCLSFKPSAVELMDTMLIDLAKGQRNLKAAMGAIRGNPAALLMVEVSSDDPAEIEDTLAKMQVALKGAKGLTATVLATDEPGSPPLASLLWNMRRAAVPLLQNLPGKRKPITFVEDAAVAPERLPEFADRMRAIFQRHGTDGAFYGHASVGCLHIRPVLDLHDPTDVTLMRTIMNDVTDLVLEFNGCLSGEHGDGLVRSEWNRKMFGDRLYGAFQRIKHAFDPHNLFNPGKVVNAPAMEDNFRMPPGKPTPQPLTVLDYRKSEGFFRSVEVCNGAGVCRKTQGGAMCPSYRATHDEADTPRARANALRISLLGEEKKTRNAPPPMAERWVHDVMDLCLSCKACKSECPSNVDVAKLKAEHTQAYYTKHPRPLGHRMMKSIHQASPWAARFAGPLNWLGRRKTMRRLMENLAGFDRRRTLPHWEHNHFRKWMDAHKPPLGLTKRVILLDDCFTTYQEPRIGKAAVKVLEAAGYMVEVASICCGRAMISKGYLKEAQRLAKAQLPELAKRVADGTPVLGLEPSCLLTLNDEWPELVPGPDAEAVGKAAHLLEHWLPGQPHGLTFDTMPNNALFHGHCHQKALVGTAGTVQAMGLVPGLEVTALDVGCCGMAGSFGYEKEHFDISVKIANLGLVPAVQANPLAVLVATGTSCRHQIRDLTGRTAFHPVEVLANALRAKGG